jgi:hypothetical protein
MVSEQTAIYELGKNALRGLNQELATGAYLWDPNRVRRIREVMSTFTKPLIAIDLDGVLRYWDNTTKTHLLCEEAMQSIRLLRRHGFPVCVWTGTNGLEDSSIRSICKGDLSDVLVIGDENYNDEMSLSDLPEEDTYEARQPKLFALLQAVESAGWVDQESYRKIVNFEFGLTGSTKFPELLTSRGGVLIDDTLLASRTRAGNDQVTSVIQSTPSGRVPVFTCPDGRTFTHFWVNTYGDPDPQRGNTFFDEQVVQAIIDRFSSPTLTVVDSAMS